MKEECENEVDEARFLTSMTKQELLSALKRVKTRIQDIQTRHIQDLEALYKLQAFDYQQEVEDRCRAKDNSQVHIQGENDPLIYALLDVSRNFNV